MLHGLKCRLRKELTPHIQVDVEVPPEKVWSVLGVFDYANFERIESLSALEPYPADLKTRQAVSPEDEEALKAGFNPIGTSEIALYRHDASPTSDGWDLSEVGLLLGDSNDMSLGYMMVWFNLSSAAIDSCGSVELVEASFENCAKTIAKHCQHASDFEFCVYETLGGPDLVLLIKLRNLGEDLENGCKAIYDARNMKAVDLVQRTDSKEISQIPNCHAFASTYSFLIYDDKVSKSHFESHPNNQSNLAFHTSIRTAPGHEKEILNTIAKQNNAMDWQIVVTGDSSILVKSNDLKGFFSLINESLPNTVSTGEHSHNNIHLSRTTIASNDQSKLPESFVHDSLKLSEKLSETLDEIDQILKSKPFRYLRRTTQYEIRKHIDILKAAFSKNENANSVRDLIPLLVQLKRCLSHDAWEKLLDDPQIRSMFQEEFEWFLSHFSASLRNRIEHRLETLESSFVNSLDFATNRLINAYSVVSWLTWERFIPLPEKTTYDRNEFGHCIAPQFGTMVRAGNFGGVDCRELFGFARNEVEQYHQQHIGRFEYVRPIAENGGKEGWNTPLLLMSISGAVLFKPERALFHFLHDSAELSDWLQLQYTKEIRKLINDWILDIITEKILKKLSFSDPVIKEMCRGDHDKTHEQMHKQMRKLIVEAMLLEESLCQHYKKTETSKKPIDCDEEIQKKFESFHADLRSHQSNRTFPLERGLAIVIENASPLFFFEKLIGVLLRLNTYELKVILELPVTQAAEGFDENIDATFRKSLRTFGVSDEYSNSFTNWIENFRGSLVEILSDLGAWFCLKQLFSLGPKKIDTEELRLWVLRDIFASCLEESSIEKQLPNVEFSDQYFQRFCVLYYLECTNQLDWRERVKHDFNKVVMANVDLTEEQKADLHGTLENVIRITCTNFGVLPGDNGQGVPNRSLGDRLKSMKPDFTPSFSMPSEGTPEFNLFMEFNRIWAVRFEYEQLLKDSTKNQLEDDVLKLKNEIEERRYFLLKKLWSKSQRFVMPRAYSQESPGNA